MRGSVVLDDAASKCEQVPRLCEGESVPQRSLSPPQSTHCSQLGCGFHCRPIELRGGSIPEWDLRGALPGPKRKGEWGWEDAPRNNRTLPNKHQGQHMHRWATSSCIYYIL